MSRQEDFIQAGIDYRMEHGKPMAIGGGNFAEMAKEMNRTKPFEAGAEYGYQYAKTHPNWISVEERLPEKDNEFEDYSKLVVVTDGKDFYKGMYYYGWECWVTHDLWPIKDATHWMEVQLPQPPRKEDKK
jgi:hypothetical protein